MEDHQYGGGMADLRHYIAGRPFFPSVSRPPDFLTNHRGFISPHPYDMLVFGEPSSIATTVNGGESSSAAAGGGFSGLFEMEAGGVIGGVDGGATARWPRQETLTLLEIRSRLDPKFKEANQKGPLWDEVARIMSEEHGYQRSGKKCREKFENLYKYYKKTKEGKSGKRQGKHYRFFRQLEALYGDHQPSNNSASASETYSVGASFQCNYPNYNSTSLANNNSYQEAYLVPKLSETSLISISNSLEHSNTSSSEESDTNDPKKKKKRKGKRGLKEKIKNSIKVQMKKLMEKQEAWMEKMMSTIEHKDKERVLREEQWRKQDSERVEREHKFWASERAWMEARDATLMDAFHKLTGKESRASSHYSDDHIWSESEVTRLIQLRNEMESRFQQGGGNVVSEEVMWEEIATKMGCFGYERRSALMCRDKWDSVNDYLIKCNKKRRDNANAKAKAKGSCTYYDQNHVDSNICNNQGGGEGLLAYDTSTELGTENAMKINDHRGNSPSNSNAVNDSCFRYFIGDAYGRSMN